MNMNYQLQSAKITSPSSDRFWGGCLVHEDLVVLAEIETNGGTQASHLGKSVFDQILRKYEEISVIDKNAVKILLSEITGLPHLKTAIIGLFSENQIYLGCAGRGQVVLYRAADVGTVVSGGFISSGEIIPNDRLVFHSDRLAGILGNEALAKIYKTDKLDVLEEELAAGLSSDQKSKGCAVLALFVTGKKAAIKYPFTDRIKSSTFFAKLNNLNSAFQSYFYTKTKRQKITLFLLALLLFFFIINTAARYFQKINSQKEKQAIQSLEIVKSQYEEAQNLLELNPVRSRQLLGQAKFTVSQMLAGSKKNSREYKTLFEMFEKIAETEISAYQIYKLTAVPLFFDVSLIKSEAAANSISSYQNSKVILDRQNQAVYFLDTSQKQSSIIAGSDTVKNGKIITNHGNFAYILNEDGIYSIDIEKKSADLVIPKDAGWGDIAAINAFAGNLYLLDRKNNAIWKYVATENGFSSLRSYVNQGVTVDLSNMDNMAIDGSIWVSGNEDIIKFTGGNREHFAYQGFADTITKIDNISTGDGEKNIYILDKSLKRIIVFDKDGLYKSQYQWEQLGIAQAIIASESEAKIFVLIDNKIYAIDIK